MFFIITILATNTPFNAKINKVKSEIPNITNLAANASLKAKINEDKGWILKITNLATTTALTDYNTKISEIKNKIAIDHDHDKCFTTQEFNKLTSQNFTARLKQAKVILLIS